QGDLDQQLRGLLRRYGLGRAGRDHLARRSQGIRPLDEAVRRLRYESDSGIRGIWCAGATGLYAHQGELRRETHPPPVGDLSGRLRVMARAEECLVGVRHLLRTPVVRHPLRAVQEADFPEGLMFAFFRSMTSPRQLALSCFLGLSFGAIAPAAGSS